MSLFYSDLASQTMDALQVMEQNRDPCSRMGSQNLLQGHLRKSVSSETLAMSHRFPR